MPLLRWLTSVAVLLALAACGAPPPSPDQVSIPPIAVERSRMPDVPIPAVLKLPPGKGPFPAIIVLHGCGGRGASQLAWAARLNKWGYAALIPDSLTPRDVTRVCEPEAQGLVTIRDRVGDIGSAAAWLRTQPAIRPHHIGVLGLSHGGASAVLATEQRYADFGLRAVVNYDGPCVDPDAHGDVPILVLAGAEDDWGHPAQRCGDYARAVGSAEVINVVVYPGVYHAFDNPEMPRMISNGHIMEYNQAAADDSNQRVREFLDRWVKQ